RIEASSGLSEAEVEKMRKDAEQNASADMQKKELVEAQNNAEQLMYTAEKSLKDFGDKVSEDIKKEVQEKMDALKSARNGTDSAAIKTASDALSTALQKIGAAMQSNQSAPSDQNQAGEQSAPGQEG